MSVSKKCADGTELSEELQHSDYCYFAKNMERTSGPDIFARCRY